MRASLVGLLMAAAWGAVPPPVQDAGAQTVRRSQRGTVTQRVADTHIAVVYNRPVARGRTLFGGVVRHGEIWNPGANEATTIEFSHDVLIDDEPLAAGVYSLWVLPREHGPWTIIFSKAADVFHSPYPGEAHDALRLDLRPSPGRHMETLAFYFPVVGPTSAVLALHWGTTVLEIPITTSRS